MIKIIFLSLIIFSPLYAVESFIKLKVNNEIITNIDIENETKYLVALNNELKNTDLEILNNLARESLIREKIKRNEVLNFYKFNNSDDYLNDIVEAYYKKLGINSLDDFKTYLKKYDLELNTVKDKIEIEILWNRLIGSKYQNQISINKENLQKKIEETFKENELITEYELSEIIFQTKNENEINKKKDLIKKDILDQGFKNTANIYSIAETSKFGGYLGWVSEKQLSKEIINVLENLSVNEVSEPIKITNGFIIFKIDNKKQKKVANNKEKILEEMIKSETNKKYAQFSIIHYNKLKLNSIISE
jgi:peptidyl-prolyl cis-trans isomerase SurA